MKKKLQILCIFSNILGNKNFSKLLVSVINDIDWLDVDYIFIEIDDYRKYPAPAWLRWSSTLETWWVIRKKVLVQVKSDYDFLFFQGYELTLAFQKIVKTKPAILFMDTTPTLAQRLIRQQDPSLKTKLRSIAAVVLNQALFKKIFRHIDIFLPTSSWCADSLISDYSINTEKIHVVFPAVDLNVWKPLSEKKQNEKPILLFVGNDFKRKGGEFLLELFEKHLKDNFTLRIVSNDPSLKEMSLPQGIELICGLTQKDLPCIYQSSDLFLFPSRRDQLGVVLIEAAASGLPIISTDVGGAKEIVRDNLNGYLMPYESKVEDWAQKIRSFSNDPALLEKLGVNARLFARQHFSQTEFKNRIRNALEQLQLKSSDKNL